jgi:hypothetical protein
MAAQWKKLYNLDVDCIDIGDEFVKMLIARPVHGFGKMLNPCVDCKILMLRRASELMRETGAAFLVSGEVIGQRPMSQRRDTLNVILRDAMVKGLLLRPLCAMHMEPTDPELSGLIDRSRLLNIQGRGRKAQLELAAQMDIKTIPAPAGGCRLTERENAKRYWAVLNGWENPCAEDFHAANIGRQYWATLNDNRHWLIIGRNETDNERIMNALRHGDIIFKTREYPGPAAFAPRGALWDEAMRLEAARLVASFSPKAVAAGIKITVRAALNGQTTDMSVMPGRSSLFEQCADIWPPEELRSQK